MSKQVRAAMFGVILVVTGSAAVLTVRAYRGAQLSVLIAPFENLVPVDTREDLSEFGTQVAEDLALRLAAEPASRFCPRVCPADGAAPTCDLVVSGAYTLEPPATIVCCARVTDAAGRLLCDLRWTGSRTWQTFTRDTVALTLATEIRRVGVPANGARRGGPDAELYQAAIRACYAEGPAEQNAAGRAQTAIRKMRDPSPARRITGIVAWRRGTTSEAASDLARAAARSADSELALWCLVVAGRNVDLQMDGANDRRLVATALERLPDLRAPHQLAAAIGIADIGDRRGAGVKLPPAVTRELEFIRDALSRATACRYPIHQDPSSKAIRAGTPDYRRAAEQYRSILVRDPANRCARDEVNRMFGSLRQWESAVAFWRSLSREGTRRVPTLLGHAEALMHQSYARRRSGALRDALSMNEEAANALGLPTMRVAMAMDYAERASSGLPVWERCALLRAARRLLEAARRREPAATDRGPYSPPDIYQDSPEERPTPSYEGKRWQSARWLRADGWCRAQAGDWPGALESLRLALRLVPAARTQPHCLPNPAVESGSVAPDARTQSIFTATRPVALYSDIAVRLADVALRTGDGAGARQRLQQSDGRGVWSLTTPLERDGLPVHIRAAGHTVAIYRPGEEPDAFGQPSRKPAWWFGTGGGRIARILVKDLDHDGPGRVEIVVGTDAEGVERGAVYVVDSAGRLLGRCQTGSNQASWVNDQMFVRELKAADLDGDGVDEVVALSNHRIWLTSRLCVISLDGALTAEAWHPGQYQDLDVGLSASAPSPARGDRIVFLARNNDWAGLDAMGLPPKEAEKVPDSYPVIGSLRGNGFRLQPRPYMQSGIPRGSAPSLAFYDRYERWGCPGGADRARVIGPGRVHVYCSRPDERGRRPGIVLDAQGNLRGYKDGVADDTTGLPVERPVSGRLFALLIAAERYHEPIPSLTRAVSDARTLEDSMSRRGFAGHQVHTLVNEKVTKDAVVRAIRWHKRKVGPGDTLWVHVVAHGFAGLYRDKPALFMATPTMRSWSDRASVIALDEVVDALVDAARDAHVFVTWDCCVKPRPGTAGAVSRLAFARYDSVLRDPIPGQCGLTVLTAGSASAAEVREGRLTPILSRLLRSPSAWRAVDGQLLESTLVSEAVKQVAEASAEQQVPQPLGPGDPLAALARTRTW